MALDRRLGITIKSAVGSFVIGDPAGHARHGATRAGQRCAWCRGPRRGSPRSRAAYLLEGELPAGVHDPQRQLPGLTRGDGVLESAFDHYRVVRGPAPSRSRTDHDPLNRKEYLLHVLRRV